MITGPVERSPLSHRLARRAKRTHDRLLFLARFHPLRGLRPRKAGQNCYITCSGKTDRAGAQTLAVLSTMLFAERAGIPYVHTPFQRIGHSSSPSAQTVSGDSLESAERWETFFNLGEGELSLTEIMSLQLESLPLATPSQLPFERRDVLYTLRHSHEYANAFPEQYMRIVGRFASKYYASPKESLQSYYDRAKLNIAVHVRRGDVAQHNELASRYTANEYVASLIREVLFAAQGFALPPSVHLYSEGDVGDFGELQDMEITFHLNECPFATFNNLVDSDVLLMSKSTFSYVAALLSRGIKVYESFRGTPLNHKPLPHWVVADANGKLNQRLLRRLLK